MSSETQLASSNNDKRMEVGWLSYVVGLLIDDARPRRMSEGILWTQRLALYFGLLEHLNLIRRNTNVHLKKNDESLSATPTVYDKIILVSI